MTRNIDITYGDLKDPVLKQQEADPIPMDERQLLRDRAETVFKAGSRPLDAYAAYEAARMEATYLAKNKKQDEQRLRLKSKRITGTKDTYVAPEGDMQAQFEAKGTSGDTKKGSPKKKYDWNDNRKKRSSMLVADIPEVNEGLEDEQARKARGPGARKRQG